MKSYFLILLSLLVLSACTKSSETNPVKELNQQFIGAWNTKDSEKIISLLADDVHFLQGETLFTGKSEVAQKWVRETMGTISNLKTNVVSSGTDKEIAYEAGTFSVDVLPTAPGQPYAIGEGNFILLWKKNTEGDWKLSYAQLEDLPVQVRN